MLVNSNKGKLGVIDLPIWPSRTNFINYQSCHPTRLIEIKFVNNGESGMLELKTLSFVAGMNLPPMKKGWI